MIMNNILPLSQLLLEPVLDPELDGTELDCCELLDTELDCCELLDTELDCCELLDALLLESQLARTTRQTTRNSIFIVKVAFRLHFPLVKFRRRCHWK